MIVYIKNIINLTLNSFTKLNIKTLILLALVILISIVFLLYKNTPDKSDNDLDQCTKKISEIIDKDDNNQTYVTTICNARYKHPKKTFICKMYKEIFGIDCKTYLEQKLLYEKDIHDLENERYNIDKSEIKHKIITNQTNKIPCDQNKDIYGFKVK